MWCAPIYDKDEGRECFTTGGGFIPKPHRHAYIKSGTITVMQDPYGRVQGTDAMVNNTHDLRNVHVDLHLFAHNTTVNHEAVGEVAFYDHDSGEFCAYTKIVMDGPLMTFSDILGSRGGCAEFPGFTAGRIFIYNRIYFHFTKALVNGETELTLEEGVGSVPFAYFDLATTGLNLYQIDEISFT